jgi:hypothetical protein
MAFLLLVVVLCVFLARVPKIYPVSARPVAPPEPTNHAAAALDGFESPYLGHTGSWDGKGGGMGGSSKSGDLDKEAAMGLRWTFMPVYWRALEPEGPVDLAKETPTAWQRLDAFVVEAHRRRLNILMQAPVMGGNAGGPPNWAGRREPGKSAPEQMDAAAAFAGKLASRYAPGGTLAVKQGWGLGYGVRAWELDNEPEGYLTHWKDQAGDYAEFATKTAARIKAVDPRAVIALPGCGGGHQSVNWIEGALDAPRLAGSPAYRKQAVGFSIGPVADTTTRGSTRASRAETARSSLCSTTCGMCSSAGKRGRRGLRAGASSSFGTQKGTSISWGCFPPGGGRRGACRCSRGPLPRASPRCA